MCSGWKPTIKNWRPKTNDHTKVCWFQTPVAGKLNSPRWTLHCTTSGRRDQTQTQVWNIHWTCAQQNVWLLRPCYMYDILSRLFNTYSDCRTRTRIPNQWVHCTMQKFSHWFGSGSGSLLRCFPNGYCTHFWDRSPSPRTDLHPNFTTFQSGIRVRIQTNGKFLHCIVIRVRVRIRVRIR